MFSVHSGPEVTERGSGFPDKSLNEFLWEVTLPAVRAARAAGREYIDSGKHYVPRLGRPRFSQNDHGWPSTLARERFERSDDDDAVDWAEMFGAAGDRFTRVAIEDVPELSTAIDQVVAAPTGAPVRVSRCADSGLSRLSEMLP